MLRKFFALTFASIALPLAAQQPASVAQHAVAVPTNDALVAKMIDEGTNHSHVRADLEYLTDVIGPRLTGSPEMRRANEWTQQKFREYGMDSTALESWKFGVGWTRGPMTLRMLAPQRRELLGVSWAWAPGTNGPLAGDVVYMNARTEDEFNQKFRGKLQGKWVMIGPPNPVENPSSPPTTHADSARLDSARFAIRAHTQPESYFITNRTYFVAREKPAGIVFGAEKQFGLFTMSGSPLAIVSLPFIVVGNDVYSQFARLAERGEAVRIEADVKNTFTTNELQQWNTVAEIRGSEHPDEVVIVGAHLDSWDLATGGTDNGTGAIAVLEAARILKASGVKPKRTIRFVLFAGEEEGLLGSQAYVESHRHELEKIQSVMVLDNGTGRITGMELQGREELREMWKDMLRPLTGAFGALFVKSGNKTGTDHLSFLAAGVTGFNYDQLTAGYNYTHHSQVDDFDMTVSADVAQAATVMAVNAWQFADLSELLPHPPKR
jgi:hypothetical protein